MVRMDLDWDFFGAAFLFDFDFFHDYCSSSRTIDGYGGDGVARHPAASPYLLCDSVTSIWSGNDITQTGVLTSTVKTTLTWTWT